jgi:NifU-like protein involved in Fe-S cluster formation
MASAALYTPEVLQLATGLADHAWDDALPLKGIARSRSCGSTLEIGLALDEAGRIAQVALRSRACAIGQASAAIFARAAPGRNGEEIAAALADLRAWLGEGGPMPDWPGLETIVAAKDYPGRHGAILLAWQAASEILAKRGAPG